MSNDKVESPTRKPIFVSIETFERFREMANKDGRKYDAYLGRLLDLAEQKDHA